MAISRDLMIAKAQGIFSGISSMIPDERQGAPSIAFVEDYNSLCSSAEMEFPAVYGYLPPVVEFEDLGAGVGMAPMSTYGEIRTYASQIANLLTALD